MIAHLLKQRFLRAASDEKCLGASIIIVLAITHMLMVPVIRLFHSSDLIATLLLFSGIAASYFFWRKYLLS